MKRIFVWGSLISGVAAAYLMYRRGESFRTIARKSLDNPVATLASEIKQMLGKKQPLQLGSST